MIYLSFWLHYVYVIFIIAYLLNIKIITKYVNPYHSVYVLFIAYLGYLVYLFNNGYRPSIIFFAIQMFAHIYPIILLQYLKIDDRKYGMETLMITILLYILYMNFINRTIYHVYSIENQPESWNDYLKKCQVDEYYPFCSLFRNDFTKKYLINYNE
jgi:hypothetical protein